MPLYTYLGQLLSVSGALATTQSCCCGSSSRSSQTSSGTSSGDSSGDSGSKASCPSEPSCPSCYAAFPAGFDGNCITYECYYVVGPFCPPLPSSSSYYCKEPCTDDTDCEYGSYCTRYIEPICETDGFVQGESLDDPYDNVMKCYGVAEPVDPENEECPPGYEFVREGKRAGNCVKSEDPVCPRINDGAGDFAINGELLGDGRCFYSKKYDTYAQCDSSCVGEFGGDAVCARLPGYCCNNCCQNEPCKPPPQSSSSSAESRQFSSSSYSKDPGGWICESSSSVVPPRSSSSSRLPSGRASSSSSSATRSSASKGCCCTLSNSGRAGFMTCPEGWIEDWTNPGGGGEPGCLKQFAIECDGTCEETNPADPFFGQTGTITPGPCNRISSSSSRCAEGSQCAPPLISPCVRDPEFNVCWRTYTYFQCISGECVVYGFERIPCDDCCERYLGEGRPCPVGTRCCNGSCKPDAEPCNCWWCDGSGNCYEESHPAGDGWCYDVGLAATQDECVNGNVSELIEPCLGSTSAVVNLEPPPTSATGS